MSFLAISVHQHLVSSGTAHHRTVDLENSTMTVKPGESILVSAVHKKKKKLSKIAGKHHDMY